MRVVIAVGALLAAGSLAAAQQTGDSPFSGMDWASGTGRWGAPIPSSFSQRNVQPATEPSLCFHDGEPPISAANLLTGAHEKSSRIRLEPPVVQRKPALVVNTYYAPELSSIVLALAGLTPLLLERRRARSR